jgi:hypothetical protein
MIVIFQGVSCTLAVICFIDAFYFTFSFVCVFFLLHDFSFAPFQIGPLDIRMNSYYYYYYHEFKQNTNSY